MAKPIEMPFWLFGYGLGLAQGITYLMWVQIAPSEGQFLGKGHPRACPTTLCRQLRKNSRTDRYVVWVVDSGGP